MTGMSILPVETITTASFFVAGLVLLILLSALLMILIFGKGREHS